MECPFHPQYESVASCVQCGKPICTVCVSETNQVLLCLDCHRARVNELSAVLEFTPAQKKAARRKKEPKPAARGRGGKTEAARAPEARPAFQLGATGSIWEKEELVEALEEGEPSVKAAAAAPAAVPEEAPLSRKERARLKKEEAKRLKMEKKLAKKGAAAEAAVPEEAFEPLMPEPEPFVEAAVETPAPEPLPPQPEEREEKTASALPDLPLDLIGEGKREGVRLPRLDDRLELLPPLEEEKGGPPPGFEPPEGFFD